MRKKRKLKEIISMSKVMVCEKIERREHFDLSINSGNFERKFQVME